jgi:hypothetical protein
MFSWQRPTSNHEFFHFCAENRKLRTVASFRLDLTEIWQCL